MSRQTHQHHLYPSSMMPLQSGPFLYRAQSCVISQVYPRLCRKSTATYLTESISRLKSWARVNMAQCTKFAKKALKKFLQQKSCFTRPTNVKRRW